MHWEDQRKREHIHSSTATWAHHDCWGDICAAAPSHILTLTGGRTDCGEGSVQPTNQPQKTRRAACVEMKTFSFRYLPFI